MTPVEALQKYFGFGEFRDGQLEIIEAILRGENALAIMPTGGGKSLCYQLPALINPGLTLVVSPLIALMKDQVDALCARGIAAGFINSSLSAAEHRNRLREMASGELKLIYVAPERFRNDSFLDSLRQINLSLFAVDEAHCISQWGHDFRPDYYRMGQVLDRLNNPQVLALTATATPAVRADILKALHLPNARTFVAGFARPNLSLRVTPVQNDSEKFSKLQQLVQTQKTGIIYCATRKKVEAVAVELTEWGVPFVAYHGGMEEAKRTAAQERFIRKDAHVAVATNAFGMGIDRDDLRFVAHFEIPGSIEAYYQEVGRAGRDGSPSVCELFFLHPDIRVQEFFLEGSNPGFEIISNLWKTLREHANHKHELEISITDIAELVKGCKNDMAISSAITTLGRAGYLERYDIPGKLLRGTRLLRPHVQPSALDIDRDALDSKERIDRERLRQIIDFAYGQGCRQQYILQALGEVTAAACGNCDRCVARQNRKIRPPTSEEAVVFQKMLSCVARMSWRSATGWVGRFGRQRIVQVLIGSKLKPLQDLGLDQLSTYGILRNAGEPYVQDLMREAIEAGFLAVETGQYPVISLTSQGEKIMRGDTNYQIVWPRVGEGASSHSESSKNKSSKSPKTKVAKKPIPLGDLELFGKLQQRRMTLAQQYALPAQLIASDTTLQALAERRPLTTKAATSLLGGRKSTKARKLLPSLVEVIRHYQQGKNK